MLNVKTLIGATGGDVLERDDAGRTLVIAVAWDMDGPELEAVGALESLGWDVDVVWAE